MNLIPWRNKRERETRGLGETPLARLREEMDELFERFWTEGWPWPMGERGTVPRMLGPRVDLAETENDVTVTAELPGVDPNDIEINIVGNTLTLRGEKKHEREEKKKNYHYVERSYGSFHRSIPLPTTVDPDKVDATYKDGVLTVTVAKHPEAKPKRIPVKSR